MKGIYKFTNLVNGKSYIGQSVNLEERHKAHKRNYINPKHPAYNSIFYRALRKYGFENFDYQILAQSDKYTIEELNELEIYYIKHYQSYQCGYNMNPGGNNTGSNYFINFNTVLLIKEDLKNNRNLTLTDIAKKFGLSSISIVSRINSGLSYKSVGNYEYPIRKHEEIKTVWQGENNSKAIFSNEEVLNIRIAFQDLDLNTLYLKYKDKISFSAFKKIVYGQNFQHLPIYKKNQKKWFLNGTCIDYPRKEEQGSQ